MKTARPRTIRAEMRGIALLCTAIIIAVGLPPQIRKLTTNAEPIIIRQIQGCDSSELYAQRTHLPSPSVVETPKASTRTVRSTLYDTTPIDINSTSQEELQRLKGIGPVLSKRIIKFRDKLGGFHSVDQVGETYGLDSIVFEDIATQLTIATPYRKIGLDTVSFKSLLRHPYLHYEHVRMIKSHDFKAATTIDSQLISAGIPDSVSAKISPYLQLTSLDQ